MIVYQCLQWLKCPSVLWWSGMLGNQNAWSWTLERGKQKVCVCFVMSCNGFGGALVGCWMDRGNPTEIQQDQKPHTSLPNGRKADETEERGGGGNKASEEQRRETKNEKGTKNDSADLTIKHTLELDFLFWQTAMERRRKKIKGSSGNKETGQILKEVKLPDWSHKERYKENSCTSLHRNKDETGGILRGFQQEEKNERTFILKWDRKDLNHWACSFYL